MNTRIPKITLIVIIMIILNFSRKSKFSLYNIMLMTIVEAANKLLEYFAKNVSFSLEENYKDLILISENPDETKIAFILALEDLEKSDLIKSHQIGKKRIYILKKPLNSYDQNLSLSGFTCNLIAQVINDFCEQIKDKKDYCDAKNISEKDIRNLIFLASMTTSKKETP